MQGINSPINCPFTDCQEHKTGECAKYLQGARVQRRSDGRLGKIGNDFGGVYNIPLEICDVPVIWDDYPEPCTESTFNLHISQL